jgi:hypothetical protein
VESGQVMVSPFTQWWTVFKDGVVREDAWLLGLLLLLVVMIVLRRRPVPGHRANAEESVLMDSGDFQGDEGETPGQCRDAPGTGKKL